MGLVHRIIDLEPLDCWFKLHQSESSARNYMKLVYLDYKEQHYEGSPD